MGDALFDDDDGLLPADWDLPLAIRQRLGHTVGRQRVMHEGGHLLVIVHQVPDPEQDERVGCLAWREPGGRWRSVGGGEGRVALRKTIDDYATALAALDERLERDLPIDEYFEILEHLAPMTRAARHLHATVQAAREACPSDRGLIDLRDRAYSNERRAELMAGDARFALDRALARSSHEHTLASRRGAEAADRLNRLAALFLPLGTAAAVLGMNVQTGLESLPPPWPLAIIMGAGLLVGIVLSHRIHRAPTDETNA
ncbi:MAG: hypothetical protein AAGF11_18795 [Myxococcota bacterium]